MRLDSYSSLSDTPAAENNCKLLVIVNKFIGVKYISMVDHYFEITEKLYTTLFLLHIINIGLGG